MWKEDAHLSDAEIVQVIDGEVSGRESSRMAEHLTACWQCRTRRSELERTISSYVAVHRTADPKLPPIDEARARLLANLIQLAAQPAPRSESSWRSRLLAYGSIAACVVAAVGITLYFSFPGMNAAPMPNGKLTPGVTRAVSTEDLCSSNVAEDFYPIPAGLAQSVFENYQIENPMPRHYEVDYLITPALGGAGDIRNLWPQPYADGEWNAHVKDALEDHLHDLVCHGRLALETAQRDIAKNWVEAYRKYFKTDRPLPDHVAFSVDPPWE